MKRATDWISKMLSEADGSPSVKRVLFTLALCAVIGFVAGDFLRGKMLTDHAVELLKNALLYTAGAYGVGRFAEASENNNGPK